MERVRIFVLCSFLLVITVPLNEAANETTIPTTIGFITADVIDERGKMNVTFHHVCKLPHERRIEFCKDLLKKDFAVRNNIKYNEGEPLGEELRYEFTLNEVRGINLNKESVHMTACTCPTTPTLYLRNNFELETVVDVYVILPYSAHGSATTRIHTRPPHDF